MNTAIMFANVVKLSLYMTWSVMQFTLVHKVIQEMITSDTRICGVKSSEWTFVHKVLQEMIRSDTRFC